MICDQCYRDKSRDVKANDPWPPPNQKQTKLHEQVDVQTKDSSLSNSSKQREEKIKVILYLDIQNINKIQYAAQLIINNDLFYF